MFTRPEVNQKRRVSERGSGSVSNPRQTRTYSDFGGQIVPDVPLVERVLDEERNLVRHVQPDLFGERRRLGKVGQVLDQERQWSMQQPAFAVSSRSVTAVPQRGGRAHLLQVDLDVLIR